MEPTVSQVPLQTMPPDRARIVSTPGTCGGKPRIDGHRISVEDVAVWHERMGMSPDEIVSAYPGLTLADVHAVLAYCFENRVGIDAAITEGEKMVEELRANAPPSMVREKLRQRKANGSIDPHSPR